MKYFACQGMVQNQRKCSLKWNKPRPTVPSRFLYELTGQTGNPNYWRAIAGEPPVAVK